MKQYTPLYELDSSSLAHVELLADSTTPTGIQAQAILTLNIDTVYWRMPESLPYIGANLRVGQFEEVIDSLSATLNIKPNPNDGSFIVTYKLPSGVSGGSVVVVNTLGEIVFQSSVSAEYSQLEILLENPGTGLFNCLLITGKSPVVSCQFMIVRH